NRFRALQPDIVFMVSYEEDSVAIMRQAKEVNLTPKMFAGGAAGFALDTFIQGAGDAAEFVFSATSWTPSVAYPGAQELYRKLVEAWAARSPPTTRLKPTWLSSSPPTRSTGPRPWPPTPSGKP